MFLQDLIFLLLVASALMAIDIATNRWRGLRAETKTAALLIETAIFLDRIAIYCEVLINCLDVDVIYKYSMVGYALLLYFGDYAISFSLLALLALAISGRAKIVEWKLDTAVMMHVQEIKRCSFAYLIVTSLILVGSSAHCFLLAICTILFGNYAIVPCILSSKCQFYRRWTSGKCMT